MPPTKLWIKGVDAPFTDYETARTVMDALKQKAQAEAQAAHRKGNCAICGERQRLDRDHDHSCCDSGRRCGRCERGLICHSCNVRIGRTHDDPAWAAWNAAATRYLDQYKENRYGAA